MRFKILTTQYDPDTYLNFGDCEFNLATLDRLINHSGLSYRRVAEIIGVSELEIEEILRDLVEEEEIEMIIPQTQERFTGEANASN